VCGPLTDADGAKVAIDPLVQDVALRKKGVLVYEEAKVQYAALLRAFEDKSGIWPDPKLPAADTTGSVASSAGAVAKAIADVATQVVPKL
jgi:hypothetical protein